MPILFRSRGRMVPATLAFCVAFSTLLLQLVQTRIYGVVFWNHLVYFIISVALLGFGISGTWLAFGSSTRLGRVLKYRYAALGFIVTTILSTLVIPQIVSFETESMVNMGSIFNLLGTYGVAVIPYFFAGWMLGMVFRDHIEHIHFLYFADLVGAGLGCLVFLAAMQPIGAINLAIVACAAVAFPVFIAEWKYNSARVFALLSVIALSAMSWYSDAINARIVPEPTKAFSALYDDVPEDEKVVEVSEWNPISRIDVVSTVNHPLQKRVFIDGDAWTSIVPVPWQEIQPFDPQSEIMLTHRAPYLFDRGDIESALVIGSGGRRRRASCPARRGKVGRRDRDQSNDVAGHAQ